MKKVQHEKSVTWKKNNMKKCKFSQWKKEKGHKNSAL